MIPPSIAAAFLNFSSADRPRFGFRRRNSCRRPFCKAVSPICLLSVETVPLRSSFFGGVGLRFFFRALSTHPGISSQSFAPTFESSFTRFYHGWFPIVAVSPKGSTKGTNGATGLVLSPYQAPNKHVLTTNISNPNLGCQN